MEKGVENMTRKEGRNGGRKGRRKEGRKRGCNKGRKKKGQTIPVKTTSFLFLLTE